MGQKELIHEISIENKLRPISRATAAEFNTSFTTTNIDTVDCEAVTLLLHTGNDDATPNYVFTPMHSDVSATDAGVACVAGDTIARAHNAAGLTSAVDEFNAADVLTMTNNASEDNIYSWSYTGPRRWFRITASVGNVANHFAVTVIKYKLKREPIQA